MHLLIVHLYKILRSILKNLCSMHILCFSEEKLKIDLRFTVSVSRHEEHEGTLG